MRRSLLVLAAALLSVRIASAAPSPSVDALRATVRGDVLVRWDRAAIDAAVPAWKGRPLAVRHHGGDLREVAGTGGGDLPADVVVLDRGARGTVIEVRPAETAGTDADGDPVRIVPASPTEPVRGRADADVVFGDVASALPPVYAADVPLWFLTAVRPGKSQRVPAGAAPVAHAAEGTLRLRVHVVGTHPGEIRLRATWSAKDLGTASVPSGVGPSVLEWTTPLSDVPRTRGEPHLDLADESPPAAPSGDPNDTSENVGTVWVDAVEWFAPPAAAQGEQALLEDGTRVAVDLAGPGLFTARADPPDPVAAARGAAMVVVATKDLLAGAERLARHRTLTGVPTAVVAATDVWDRRSLGVADPRALAAYLAEVGAGGTLRYVLLCGDATMDRGDVRPGVEPIPTLYARSLYNGATPSDRLLLGDPTGRRGGPAIGRLPFRDPRDLDAWVARVVAAETAPPADVTRRTLRFITSEGRFGPQIDALLENLFAQVVSTQIPAAYDTEVTFARVGSPFGWPPAEFAQKVLDGLNDGALFYTYVGHGFALGFDHLRVEGQRYPILDADQVPRVLVKGTPPAMFVVACTTAIFDLPDLVGVGERLLARPRGPLAYWGATRVCHPAWNSIVGRQIAIEMFRDPQRRLGDILEAAVRTSAAPPPEADTFRRTIEAGARMMLRQTKADLDRLKVEGAAMYNLLGDPALRLPFPKEDLLLSVERSGDAATVTVTGEMPDGTQVQVAVETTRDRIQPWTPDASLSPDENTRRRHARTNDKSVTRATVRAAGGTATWRAPLPAGTRGPLVAKAWAVFGDDVHQGAVPVPEPAAGK